MLDEVFRQVNMVKKTLLPSIGPRRNDVKVFATATSVTADSSNEPRLFLSNPLTETLHAGCGRHIEFLRSYSVQ